MPDGMVKWVSSLVAAQHFERAALDTLRSMLLRVQQIVSREYGPRSHVLRGVIQLRPNDTYRRLLALEMHDAQADTQVSPPARKGTISTDFTGDQRPTPVVNELSPGRIAR